MARKQNMPNREEWKAALVELIKEEDYLRTVVEEVVSRSSRWRWTKPWGRRKVNGRRTGEGIEAAIIDERSLREWASWSCGCRRTGRGTSVRSCLSDTSG